MSDKLLCIHHSNCADGFGAAWVVRYKYGEENVEFFPGIYGHEPPDVTDRDVLIVDFSYKRPVLEDMADKAKSITVLDHHKSAKLDLENFKRDNTTVVFDMERSGAGLTWDYFFAPQERPRLINYIEDRDLWKFELPGTEEIQAALFSYPYDFEIWDGLFDVNQEDVFGDKTEDFSYQDSEIDQLWSDGEVLVRKQSKDINEMIERNTRRMVIGGYDVPVINLPYMWASEAGNILSEGEPFAAVYYDGGTHRTFSLRSKDDGVDVSLIAENYGGGGHKNAAGFRVELGWTGDK